MIITVSFYIHILVYTHTQQTVRFNPGEAEKNDVTFYTSAYLEIESIYIYT